MTRFYCPNCHGGFDLPGGDDDDDPRCPWCDQPIDGSYEYEPVTNIVEKTPDEEPRRLLDIFR